MCLSLILYSCILGLAKLRTGQFWHVVCSERASECFACLFVVLSIYLGKRAGVCNVKKKNFLNEEIGMEGDEMGWNGRDDCGSSSSSLSIIWRSSHLSPAGFYDVHFYTPFQLCLINTLSTPQVALAIIYAEHRLLVSVQVYGCN